MQPSSRVFSLISLAAFSLVVKISCSPFNGKSSIVSGETTGLMAVVVGPSKGGNNETVVSLLKLAKNNNLMAVALKYTLSKKPGALAKKINQLDRSRPYDTQPKVFPSITAHGVGFKSPKVPVAAA